MAVVNFKKKRGKNKEEMEILEREKTERRNVYLRDCSILYHEIIDENFLRNISYIKEKKYETLKVLF